MTLFYYNVNNQYMEHIITIIDIIKYMFIFCLIFTLLWICIAYLLRKYCNIQWCESTDDGGCYCGPKLCENYFITQEICYWSRNYIKKQEQKVTEELVNLSTVPVRIVTV